MKTKKLALLLLSLVLSVNMGVTAKASEVESDKVENITEAVSETDLAVGDYFTVDYITYIVTSVTDTLEVGVYDASARLRAVAPPSSVTYNDVTYMVTSVTDGAFYNNTRMTSIVIPEGVRTVGDGAFRGCKNVTTISLPSTMETFTTMGFAGLESITLASGNEHFQLIDGVLFSKDGTKLWLYPSAKAGTTYTVPEGTTTIVESSFYENKNLQIINLANSITSVEAYAFYQANALTAMTLGRNVSSVGEYNFKGCPNLTSITLQNSGELGMYTIYDCASLETVTIDGSLSGYGAFALHELPNLEEYIVTSSPYFTTADKVLFYGTQLLRYPAAKEGTSYVVPKDTSVIAGLAFNCMQNTSEVILPEGVSLTVMAFQYPNDTTPMSIYFRDKESVTMSSSRSGVFVGLVEGSKIYLPTEAALASFNTYSSAINPAGSVTAEVGSIPSTAITLNSTEVELGVGQTYTLVETLTPFNSTDLVAWVSSDSSVASVSANGVITGVGNGNCTITATTDSGATAIANVSISEAGVAAYTLSRFEDTEIELEPSLPDYSSVVFNPEGKYAME